jgi:hypothetical protein
MNKNQPALARWYSNHELAKMFLTKDNPCYVYFGYAPGKFRVDDEMVVVENPKCGMVVKLEEKWHEKPCPALQRRLLEPGEVARNG